ncbi:hypothetical protein [Mesorhizobium sp. M0910]|uniref:hypothetical protein n=1 Tax=Mesorhizobium sp. M0910 TaxID=2957025 RepID=UPI003335A157
MNKFKIVVGKEPHTCSVEMNGLPVEGICRVSFDLSSGQKGTMLHLEIMGEILVEGEFRDDAILQVRQPAPDVRLVSPSK